MNDEATQALSLMAINSGNQSGHMALTERFEKIQGARPGGPLNENGPKNGKTLRIVPRARQNARSRRYNR